MKDRIKEYLQDKGKVTVNDLAQALGKDSSKDFRELIKTLSLMERKHQIRFEEDGSLTLEIKKNMRLPSRGFFMPIKMALALLVWKARRTTFL
ncbi:exoribonuclease, VacB/Rnb family [Streptococcus pneumoniae GA17227]|nr:exoribonuclease, VacB/Rnb family [Streptococcus pneumoniae GA17227]EHE31324.1 exoribonuclease, VacB/Rnb family [Streptococcus pneumoniae GA47283]EJG45380.1 exoribonuclease, VacB/Rnb family domain protein [Streptococcus pneumoniae 2070335]